MRTKVPVEMSVQAFNGHNSISSIKFKTAFEIGCNTSRIHNRAAVSLFTKFMSGPAFAAIKRR